MTIVEVWWKDAYSDNGTRLEVGQSTDPYLPTHTVGYLIKRNRKSIILGQNFVPTDKGIRNLMVIPASMILKIRRLK